MSNTELSPDTVLGLAPNLRTRLTGAGHVLLDTSNGTVVDLGPHGFTILAQFAPPLPLGDALARLEAAWGRSTEFAPAVNVVTMLIEEEATTLACPAEAGEMLAGEIVVAPPHRVG